MTLTELKAKVKSGAIDTVLVGFPDPFGRLVGKRYRADFFLQECVESGTHGCSYLLTVNLDMDPLDGFQVANWDSGFGDFEIRPDLGTLRILPWQTGAALVICDYQRHDGSLAPPLKDRPRRGHIGFQELSRGESQVQIRGARIMPLEKPAK